MADRYCLVRCLSHADTVHVTAAHTMLTGQETFPFFQVTVHAYSVIGFINPVSF